MPKLVIHGKNSLTADVDVIAFAASGAQTAQAHFSMLSDDEKQRALRFRCEKAMLNFINVRATLRCALGESMNVAPESLSFVVNEYGKPALDPRKHKTERYFNVSHSGDIGVVAIARKSARLERLSLGVDVERITDTLPGDRSVIQNFFSTEERRQLSILTPDQRKVGFFCVWTRKEAVLKAIGTGLSMSPQSFDVTTGSKEKPRLTRCEWDDPAEWQLEHLDLFEGYVGALAVRTRKAIRLNCTTGLVAEGQ